VVQYCSGRAGTDRLTPDCKVFDVDVEVLITDRFDTKREKILTGGGRKPRRYLSQKSEVKDLCVLLNPRSQF
jgi:hypothetical protein